MMSSVRHSIIKKEDVFRDMYINICTKLYNTCGKTKKKHTSKGNWGEVSNR